MSVAFIARQPIFDRRNDLVGYELLYRPGVAAVAAGVSADSVSMTGTTLVSGMLAIGLEQLTGKARAWVNFPRELLLAQDFDLLDPKRCTIELLETVACDEQSVAACQALRDKGFTLALDDFVAGPEYAPLLRLAHIVKLEVMGREESELRGVVNRLKPFGVQLLAEKIENKDEYAMCQRLGFSLFQGYYFSRPELVQRRDLPVEMQGIAKLMKLLLETDIHDREIEKEFQSSPGLTLKLLRIVNAAWMGGRNIASIGHAVRLTGRATLHRWLALLLVSMTPRSSDVDQELLLNCLERARFCELLATRTDARVEESALFLTGLLSTFDRILGMTMPELLTHVRVAPEVEAALLGQEGAYTPILNLATAYAAGEWDTAVELGERVGAVDELPEWFAESAGWAREMIRHG